MKIQFEKRVCSRCAGDGYFTNYGHIHAGKCFKCHGAGKILTKNGRTAWDAYRTVMTVPASKLEIGMIVTLEDLNPFTGAITAGKRRVHSIEEALPASIYVDGVKKEIPMFKISFANNSEVTTTRILSDSDKFLMGLNKGTRQLAIDGLSKLKGATITE
tara:strand:+ start:1326 stop:1802 length:477 start_codon:yes stop_codon:yes gene_type:complete